MEEFLKKIQKSGPYRPSKRDIKVWFSVINELIFHGRIPKFRKISLVKRKDCYAVCSEKMDYNGNRWCELEIDKEFKDFHFFITILAHEMIHAYQWTVECRPMSHGKFFWKWKREFDRMRIPLFVRY